MLILKQSGEADRHHQTGLDVTSLEFVPPAASEAVARQSFPECAAYHVRRMQHGVALLWIAEPARCSCRPPRGRAAVAVDGAKDASGTDVIQPRAQPVRVVAARHAKSPCRSPSAAFATRLPSPPACSVSGAASSREDSSVVSQAYAV